MRIILASQSETRYNILTGFGIVPEVIKTDADENINGSPEFPDFIVKELALRKAAKAIETIKTIEAVEMTETSAMIIAADTVVAFENKILNKPENESGAFEMLSMLSGKNHEVYSGLAVAYNGRTLCDFDVSRVKFKEISEREINLYIKTGDPMTRAGAYGAEGLGATFIERIDGDFFNIAGLPVYKFVKLLKDEFGLSIFDLI
jgi:septum formation protein